MGETNSLIHWRKIDSEDYRRLLEENKTMEDVSDVADVLAEVH